MKNNQIFKVGLIIQSFNMNKFEKEIVDNLYSDKNIELIAILEKKKNFNLVNKISFLLKKYSLWRIFEILFFKIIFLAEKKFYLFFLMI